MLVKNQTSIQVHLYFYSHSSCPAFRFFFSSPLHQV